tara:strand:- start:955 stop:1785 length:831 start_codon:yes stop_codon:yes gene_type:complete
MNLWIVTVNFGSIAPTKSLIDSLSNLDNLDSIKLTVCIADNAASERSSFQLKELLNKSKLDMKIFSYKKNHYYWPAAKRIIEKMKNSIGAYPDWVIICNNDIIFSDSSFIKQLIKIDRKKYPIVGPNIINSNRKKLNPFMSSPLSPIQSIYWKLYFFSYPLSKILLGIKNIFSFFSKILESKKINTVQKVYAVHGSAILFSNYFFSNGGWLDDNFEMYGEELTVAEIAKKLNLPVTYFPQLEIIHHEHRNTGSMNKRSLFYIAKKSHQYFESTYKK